MNLQTILELLSALTSLVSLSGNWQAVVADVEAILAAVATNPPVFPAGSTMLQDFEILVTWGLANESLFAKVLQDILALVNAKKAAAGAA